MIKRFASLLTKFPLKLTQAIGLQIWLVSCFLLLVYDVRYHNKTFALISSLIILHWLVKSINQPIKAAHPKASLAPLIAFFLIYGFNIFSIERPEVMGSHLRQISICLLMVALGGIAVRHNAYFSDHGMSSFKASKLLNSYTFLIHTSTLVILLLILVQHGRDDIFLAKFQHTEVYHQDFADALVVATIFCVHSLLFFSFNNGAQHPGRASLCGLRIIFLGVVGFFLSQYSGSNSGAVSIFLITIVASYISSHLLTHPIQRIIAQASLASAYIFIIVVIALYIPPLRLVNYQSFDAANMHQAEERGEGIVPSSLASRMEILKKSTTDQIAFSPLLGDLEVEHKLGIPGQHLHSILTIQTHLGAVGSIAFLLMAINIIAFSANCRASRITLFLVLPIIFVGVLGKFFTWPPLWFSIGMLIWPNKLYPMARVMADKRKI